MVNIIVNAGLVSSVISGALTKTGDFRVTELAQAGLPELEDMLRTTGADMLLLNVGLHPEFIVLEERVRQIRSIREKFAACKIVLLMDTNIGGDKLNRAVVLKQAGLIDSFLYADCSMEFLVATLQSMLLE